MRQRNVRGHGREETMCDGKLVKRKWRRVGSWWGYRGKRARDKEGGERDNGGEGNIIVG